MLIAGKLVDTLMIYEDIPYKMDGDALLSQAFYITEQLFQEQDISYSTDYSTTYFKNQSEIWNYLNETIISHNTSEPSLVQNNTNIFSLPPFDKVKIFSIFNEGFSNPVLQNILTFTPEEMESQNLVEENN